MPKRESHCSACGRGWPAGQPWPRCCAGCGTVSHHSPLPAVAVLLPVHDSVLLVRHAGGPFAGQLGLPGGYIELGEGWQQAAVRRLKVESGVAVAREELTLYDVVACDDLLLVAGLGKARSAAGLPRFKPNPQVAELVLASSMLELARPAHAQLLKRWFSAKQGRLRRRTSQVE
jgi:ADP-ribose pyrophosphatase YjhB (NUDIX family)